MFEAGMAIGHMIFQSLMVTKLSVAETALDHDDTFAHGNMLVKMDNFGSFEIARGAMIHHYRWQFWEVIPPQMHRHGAWEIWCPVAKRALNSLLIVHFISKNRVFFDITSMLCALMPCRQMVFHVLHGVENSKANHTGELLLFHPLMLMINVTAQFLSPFEHDGAKLAFPRETSYIALYTFLAFYFRVTLITLENLTALHNIMVGCTFCASGYGCGTSRSKIHMAVEPIRAWTCAR